MAALFLFLSLLLLGAGYPAEAARILAAIPTPSISHQFPFQLLASALAARGHQVTYITPNLIKDANENITQIDVSSSYAIWNEQLNFADEHQNEPLTLFMKIIEISEKMCDQQLNSSGVQEIIRSGQTFDLFILESIMYHSYFGLYHKVGSPPLVGFTSLSMLPHVQLSMGNPFNPSYQPHLLLETTDHMSFWQRLQNVLLTAITSYFQYYIAIPTQERLMRKHFGEEVPPVFETEFNYSLMIVNNHFTSYYPIPNLPNVVELTGVHIQKKRQPLPEDIKNFLDGAKEGAIYFSLGSNVKSKDLPEEKRRAFLEAFSELPQRVLWKWETDNLPEKPDNVMISKWLPQQDVLAHPNIVAFITQGGLQSMNEASYFAIPLIGVPFFGDQAFNVAKMETAGIGVRLKDFTNQSVKNAVKMVLQDPSYRENMRRFSAVFREHQAESLDKAVWWVEYALRHSGARHLRSAALDLRWWQLLLLDVAAALLAAGTLAACLCYLATHKVLAALRPATKIKTS